MAEHTHSDHEILPQGKLAYSYTYSDDPRKPAMSASIHCEGANVPGGLNTEIVKHALEPFIAQGLKVSTPDKNTLNLKFAKFKPSFKQTTLTPHASNSDYLLHSLMLEVVQKLQTELSTRNFTLPLTGKSGDNELYAVMNITPGTAGADCVKIVFGTCNYDHKARPSGYTEGRGNDPSKTPLAMAAIERLVPSLRARLLDGKGTAYHYKVGEMGGMAMILETESRGENTQKVYADLAQQMAAMEKDGVAVTHTQKVLEQRQSGVKPEQSQQIADLLLCELGASVPDAMRKHIRLSIEDIMSGRRKGPDAPSP